LISSNQVASFFNFVAEVALMKRIGGVSTAVLLFLLLGATAFGYAQHEQQSENQGKPEKQAKPEKQKGKQQQQDQNKQQHAQRQQRQDQNKQEQHARQQQPERTQRASLSEHRKVWQQHRAHSWESEHRTWQQRGGYNGYRIPDDRFRRYYGRDHWFRVYSLPFMVEGGYPRFQYGGYWLSFVDPYPEYWGDNWYETDDVYVDYYNDGYYLYNRRYAGRPGVAISISF
jgi:hypothetical protein